MADLRARLVKCFEAVFLDLPQEQLLRASMASLPKWDSVASVTLVAVIEQEFGIQVQDDDLAMFVSFESVEELLRSKNVS